jgi:hypothetical protein
MSDILKEIQKLVCNEAKDKDIRIVILQRGWVMVGEYSRVENDCFLKNCSTIRKWGTSRGLGQIAMEGPTSETILDKQPDTEFHILTIVASIKCDASKW